MNVQTIQDYLKSGDTNKIFLACLVVEYLKLFQIPHIHKSLYASGYIPPQARWSKPGSIGQTAQENDFIMRTFETVADRIDSEGLAPVQKDANDQINYNINGPFLANLTDSEPLFCYLMECLEYLYTKLTRNAVTSHIADASTQTPYSWNTFKYVIVPSKPGDIKSVQIVKRPGTEYDFFINIRVVMEGGIDTKNYGSRPANEFFKSTSVQHANQWEEIRENYGFPYTESYSEYLRFLNAKFKSFDARISNRLSVTFNLKDITELFIPIP
jgi:hypothetical protein